LEGPCVVRAAERVGQRRVFDLALPDDPETGIEHLLLEALLVEEAHARLHVLPLLAVAAVAVEVADVESLLLLAVAGQDAHHLVHVAQLEHLAVADHRSLAGLGLAHQPHRAFAEGGIDVALEEIERLHEMAVTVDGLDHRGTSACGLYGPLLAKFATSAQSRGFPARGLWGL